YTRGGPMSVTVDLSSWYGEQVVNYVNLPAYTTAEVELMNLEARLYADAAYTSLLATATITILDAPPGGAPASWTGAWIQETWPSASTQQSPGAYYHSLADVNSNT